MNTRIILSLLCLLLLLPTSGTAKIVKGRKKASRKTHSVKKTRQAKKTSKKKRPAKKKKPAARPIKPPVIDDEPLPFTMNEQTEPFPTFIELPEPNPVQSSPSTQDADPQLTAPVIEEPPAVIAPLVAPIIEEPLPVVIPALSVPQEKPAPIPDPIIEEPAPAPLKQQSMPVQPVKVEQEIEKTVSVPKPATQSSPKTPKKKKTTRKKNSSNKKVKKPSKEAIPEEIIPKKMPPEYYEQRDRYRHWLADHMLPALGITTVPALINTLMFALPKDRTIPWHTTRGMIVGIITAGILGALCIPDALKKKPSKGLTPQVFQEQKQEAVEPSPTHYLS